jgi:hypothetical protein
MEELATEGCHILPGPAVMLGGSGFLRQWMEASLAHGIRYAIWHQDWSNSSHDDFIITIARMLQWQLLFSCKKKGDQPFSSRNFYALLMMAFLHHALCGLPYDENHHLTKLPQVPDWQRQAGEKARSLAQTLLGKLSGSSIDDFNAFRAEYLCVYVEEMTHKAAIERQHCTK